MQTLHFLKPKEKKTILAELKKIYGITELPYLLLETGKQKIRGFSGHLSKEEIQDLNKTANIELIGMYLISRKDAEPRINFDAISLFNITKNIIEINKPQLELWLRGNDLEMPTQQGTILLKYKEDLVGLGLIH